MTAISSFASSNIRLTTDPAAPGTTTATGTGSAGGLGKDDFLRLLVAQLQHQDPLNPLQNEGYIAQLATFSSLEQLIAIREGITKLAESPVFENDQTAESATEP
jgi:flagellar hook assembly protein FlgD